MKLSSKYLLICVVGAATLAASSWVAAHNNDDDQLTVCEKSANKMFRSCRFEINEELFATKASCINQVNPDEPSKRECLKIAWETYRDDWEGCGDQREARKDVCELLGENRYGPEALLDGDKFVDNPGGNPDDGGPDTLNPYFSLTPGHTYVLRGGEGFEETTVVTVTDEVREVREVLGVHCRIVVDVVLVEEDGELVPMEVTDDYYA